MTPEWGGSPLRPKFEVERSLVVCRRSIRRTVLRLTCVRAGRTGAARARGTARRLIAWRPVRCFVSATHSVTSSIRRTLDPAVSAGGGPFDLREAIVAVLVHLLEIIHVGLGLLLGKVTGRTSKRLRPQRAALPLSHLQI